VCLHRCKRCGCYLGDGNLLSDDERKAAEEENESANASGTSIDEKGALQFGLEDVRDVRLALHCVRLSQTIGTSSGSAGLQQEKGVVFSVEQV
jgi:hypothetical protein